MFRFYMKIQVEDDQLPTPPFDLRFNSQLLFNPTQR